MNHLALMLLASTLGANYQPEFMALFTTLEFRYSGGGYQNELFRYRLFIPSISDRNDKKPLIVWLNGFGEAGDDNIQQLAGCRSSCSVRRGSVSGTHFFSSLFRARLVIHRGPGVAAKTR